MKTPPTILSVFIKDMRRKHHLTQIDLAEKSGVELNFVCNLEQGKPTLRLLTKPTRCSPSSKQSAVPVNMRKKHSV